MPIMPKDKFEQQMDKQIKAKDYSKFLAYFYQYLAQNTSPSKNLVYYKTVALLFYLSQEQYEEYFVLIQSCIDAENYEYVINVYDSINLCNYEQLNHLQNKADSSYKNLLQKIAQNTKQNFESEGKETAFPENLPVNLNNNEQNMTTCLHIINNFRK